MLKVHIIRRTELELWGGRGGSRGWTQYSSKEVVIFNDAYKNITQVRI